MYRVGIVGLGKMGISHFALANAHPDAEVVAVCDTTRYLLDVVEKYASVTTYNNPEDMFAKAQLDAVIISTPTRFHATLVKQAIDAGVHVFCEKPFVLTSSEGNALTEAAADAALVTQVGYHYKFVASFAEVKRLLDLQAIGPVSHYLAEAYGGVVLKPQGSTWRSKREQGGGCLYDYAAHPIDLAIWLLGEPASVSGSTLNSVFSRDVDDEVYSTLNYANGTTGHLATNWSDESQRKMSTKISIWGANGHVVADRQELKLFLGKNADVPEGYNRGWNMRYTTDLTPPVWFYLRGEEYSAQMDYFFASITAQRLDGLNHFAQALKTDRVIECIVNNAEQQTVTQVGDAPVIAAPSPAPGFIQRFIQLFQKRTN